MIPTKGNEPRRGRRVKLNKHLDELYRKGKCREFSVVVTRMDFAKILGKFTKVKIQYESSSPTKTRGSSAKSAQSNSRLKSNENGMVMIHRNAYNKHPADKVCPPKKRYAEKTYSRPPSNILKENNRQKKPIATTDNNSNYNITVPNVTYKRYGIIFNLPNTKEKSQIKCDISLAQLFPAINKNILPSEEWCIDYFPKDEEPKEDKVYDRIKAELEGLMCLEKNIKSPNKIDSIVNPTSDFPSIMDILNDNTESTQKAESNNIEIKTSLESCDVEAMLLGKTDESEKSTVTPMDIDASPNSPTILDEALQKGIEEQLIGLSSAPLDSATTTNSETKPSETEDTAKEKQSDMFDSKSEESETLGPKAETVTHVVFKKIVNGNCFKSVTCPKTMNYTVELEGKKVEFIGAPRFVSSVDDLQVLLQIVDDTSLNNLYVLQ